MTSAGLSYGQTGVQTLHEVLTVCHTATPAPVRHCALYEAYFRKRLTGSLFYRHLQVIFGTTLADYVLSGAFAKLRKATTSFMSVRPHEKSRLLLDFTVALCASLHFKKRQK